MRKLVSLALNVAIISLIITSLFGSKPMWQKPATPEVAVSLNAR